MLKIRLMRIGARKRPYYRVVAVDERKKRTGGYLDLLGTYNPLTQPKEINLDQKKIDEWIKKGAQPSDGFLRIIGKAKQRPPRPAKKQKKEVAAPQPQPAANEEKVVEDATEISVTPTEEAVTTKETVVAEVQTQPENDAGENQDQVKPASEETTPETPSEKDLENK